VHFDPAGPSKFDLPREVGLPHKCPSNATVRVQVSGIIGLAGNAHILLQSAYGSEDRRTIRAQEIRDAIQRLQ
jgi:hypothetical protein